MHLDIFLFITIDGSSAQYSKSFGNDMDYKICLLLKFTVSKGPTISGADPGFQVRGEGGGALKKIAPSGGKRENIWGISCKR